MRRELLILVVLASIVAGCGRGDGETATRSATTTEQAEEGSTTTTADGGTDPTELPGEPIDIFPSEGAELGVVGVAVDDVLNVRSGPSTDFAVVARLEPVATGIVATGSNRSVEDSGIWAEIRAAGVTGWANVSFLAHLGRTDDITTELFPTSEDRLRADTMLQLGEEIAAMRASEEPASDVVVVDGPTVEDVGHITVDVIGLGDDSLAGERLHVVGEPGAGGESFTVRSVERTLLCARGVSDGLCV